MKLKSFVAAVMITAGGLTAWGSGADTADSGAAKSEKSLVYADGMEIDLGALEQGEMKTGSLKLLNAGTDTLSIVSAFAECGCTKVEYPRQPIAPGDTVTVSATFNSKNRAYGHFVKAVRLRTNSGERTLLLVKGEIKRPYKR